jgi:hypothetical protein
MSEAVLNDDKGGALRRLPSYVSARLRAQCYRLLAGLLQSGASLSEAAAYAVEVAEQQKKSGMPSMDQTAMADFLDVFSSRWGHVDAQDETEAALLRVSLAEQILLRRLFKLSASSDLGGAAQAILLARAAEILESEVLFASLDRPASPSNFVGLMTPEPVTES